MILPDAQNHPGSKLAALIFPQRTCWKFFHIWITQLVQFLSLASEHSLGEHSKNCQFHWFLFKIHRCSKPILANTIGLIHPLRKSVSNTLAEECSERIKSLV